MDDHTSVYIENNDNNKRQRTLGNDDSSRSNNSSVMEGESEGRDGGLCEGFNVNIKNYNVHISSDGKIHPPVAWWPKRPTILIDCHENMWRIRSSSCNSDGEEVENGVCKHCISCQFEFDSGSTQESVESVSYKKKMPTSPSAVRAVVKTLTPYVITPVIKYFENGGQENSNPRDVAALLFFGSPGLAYS